MKIIFRIIAFIMSSPPWLMDYKCIFVAKKNGSIATSSHTTCDNLSHFTLVDNFLSIEDL